MAPKWRKLHTKALESLDIHEMPNDFTRLFWLLLPLVCDREGRGLDSASWLKSKVFPIRDDVTLEQIGTAFQWFFDRGMVECYEVRGRSYFYLPTFKTYQGDTSKEAESEYPPPPVPVGEFVDISQELVESKSGVGQELVPPKSASDADADADADPDTKADSEADSILICDAADAAPPPPAPEPVAKPAPIPLTEGLTAFLALFNAKRFANRTQAGKVAQLEIDYGVDKLMEAGRWAATRGLGLGQAVPAVAGALPKWGQPRASPGGNGKNEPKGWAAIREWDHQRAQEGGQHGN